LLTPLSLQYHNHNNPNQSHTLGNLSHHHHHPHHQLQTLGQAYHHHAGGQGGGGASTQYATTHRTFPSNHQTDLVFSSLNRKGRLNNGSSNKVPADIMEIAGNGTNRRVGGGPNNGGGGGMWHADLIYGHPQNGRGNNGHIPAGAMMNNGSSGGGGGSHPLSQSNNGYLPNGGGMSGNTNGRPGSTSHPPLSSQIPIINPGAAFPIIRGNEINV